MSFFFPTKTIEKMKNIGVSERDISDVFTSGERVKDNIMVKKYEYYRYEIGFYYKRDHKTGQYMITGVWKRERR